MADKVELNDGKYTVVNDLSEGGGFYALRYGEEWRNLAGDKLVYTMFCEIERLRKSKEICKRMVGGLTYENAILKGEEPITVHVNKEEVRKYDE